MSWHNIKDTPLPDGRLIIGLEEWSDGTASWLIIGDKESDDSIASHHTPWISVFGITWWHEIPELPTKEESRWCAYSDNWFDCKKYPPPSKDRSSVEFILFDEEDGITEAEYWDGYQSDTSSCKVIYHKPLFWAPFPRLPIKSNQSILQW
jgi:hypothetical protein